VSGELARARIVGSLLVVAMSTAAAVAADGQAAPPREGAAANAKAFTLPGLDGLQHRLSDWSGKVIVLNFWASWCGPCQQEIRDFVGYQEKFAVRGLQVIGIGLDEERRLRNVQRTLAINYPVLVVDPVHDVGILRAWGNSSGAIPYTVVIDRLGRIAHIHRGPMQSEQIEEIVVPLLDGS
jgi:peroxiredoxin